MSASAAAIASRCRTGPASSGPSSASTSRLDPPHRLVYTWRWESHADPPGESEVTVVTLEFVAEGSATRVVLEQRSFADEAGRDRHDRGWRGCLDNLERRVLDRPRSA